jgi:hypothetical protein
MKYGEPFTPEEDELILPWTDRPSLYVPFEVQLAISKQLDRPREAIRNRMEYLYRKRYNKKARTEFGHSRFDERAAEKIMEVYKKQPRAARVLFLRHVRADELAETRQPLKRMIETTAQDEREPTALQPPK